MRGNVNNNKYNLEYVLDRYDALIFDACTLIQGITSYLQQGNDYNQSKQHKIWRVHQDIDYLKFLNALLESNKPLYITESIKQESKSVRSIESYRKQVKSYRKRAIPDKTMGDFLAERSRLLSKYENKNKIIKKSDLDQKMYCSLSNNYRHLMDKNKLSEPDFDLLITGLVFAYDKNTAIMTKDQGILRAWEQIKKQEAVNFREYGLFFLWRNFNFMDPREYWSSLRVHGERNKQCQN